MKEETVLAVIKAKGVFQLNPLAYRNDKITKLLKTVVRKGLAQRERVKPNLVNYVLCTKGSDQ